MATFNRVLEALHKDDPDRESAVIGWRAQVRKKGFPHQSKVFRTKAQAERWAAVIESEMVRGSFVSRTESENTTVAEVLDRYVSEVVPMLKSSRAAMPR